jgi:hypothetical protein
MTTPIWKSSVRVLPLALLVALSACRTSPPTQAVLSPAPPPELVQQSYLFEIVRHLYRWQLDESEVDRLITSKQIEFWVRRLEPKLDPGDRSVLGEILLPQLTLSVKVKKADYTIEELGTLVQSRAFKITQVTRGQVPARPPRGCAVLRVDTQEMRDYLFRTRRQQDFPDPVLIERMRRAFRSQAAKEGILATNTPAGEQVVHLAPLSPVANECWVFWEAGRKLLYFASDIDLANPVVWQQEALTARLFDLDQQVVVSHEEAPGSNRFLTRSQVGRALFNCIILGQRVVVPPRSPGQN